MENITLESDTKITIDSDTGDITVEYFLVSKQRPGNMFDFLRLSGTPATVVVEILRHLSDVQQALVSCSSSVHQAYSEISKHTLQLKSELSARLNEEAKRRSEATRVADSLSNIAVAFTLPPQPQTKEITIIRDEDDSSTDVMIVDTAVPPNTPELLESSTADEPTLSPPSSQKNPDGSYRLSLDRSEQPEDRGLGGLIEEICNNVPEDLVTHADENILNDSYTTIEDDADPKEIFFAWWWRRRMAMRTSNASWIDPSLIELLRVNHVVCDCDPEDPKVHVISDTEIKRRLMLNFVQFKTEENEIGFQYLNTKELVVSYFRKQKRILEIQGGRFPEVYPMFDTPRGRRTGTPVGPVLKQAPNEIRKLKNGQMTPVKSLPAQEPPAPKKPAARKKSTTARMSVAPENDIPKKPVAPRKRTVKTATMRDEALADIQEQQQQKKRKLRKASEYIDDEAEEVPCSQVEDEIEDSDEC